MHLQIVFLFLIVLEIKFAQSNCTCYTNVEQKLNNYQSKLIEIDIKLSINQNHTNQTDVINENVILYLTNLKQLKNKTEYAIKADVKLLKDLKTINNQQDETLGVLIDVLEDFEVTESHLYDNIRNISGIQCLIDDTTNLFNNNVTIIGIEALENARTRIASLEVNSAEMLQLTNESIRISQEIVNTSIEYIKLSDDTKNISLKLDEMLLNIQNNQLSTNINSTNLTIKTQNFEQDLLKLQKLTQETLNKSQNLENQALFHLELIENIKIPIINKTDGRKNQFKAIMNETTTLLSVSNELIDKTQETISESEDILNEAIKTQNKIDTYFNKAKQYYNKSETAVNSGNETLKRAKNIYKSLSEFHEIVQTTKQNSTKSLEGIIKIEQLIDLINKQAKTAQQSLNETQININNASKIIAQTQQELPNDLKATNDHQTQLIRNNISKLNSKLLNITDSHSKTHSSVIKLENQVQNETNHIKNTNVQVAKAVKDMSKATLQIKESRNDLNDIIEELSDLGTIDDGKLDEIEAKLNKYRMEHQKIVKQVEKYKLEQQKDDEQYNLLYDNHQNDLAHLRDELRRIEVINRDLPNSCLKDYVLEP